MNIIQTMVENSTSEAIREFIKSEDYYERAQAFDKAVKEVFSDKEFIRKLNESYARNIKLRMPFWSQISKSEQQGQDAMPHLQEDV